MSRTLFAAALVLLIVRPAFSAIEIRVCSDTAGEVQCIPAPEYFQLVTAHVVVTGTNALSSLSFSVTYPPRLIWIEDQPVFPQTLGNSPIGTSVSFDGCLDSPIHVLSALLYTGPSGPEECQFAVVRDASAVDCASQPVAATGGFSRVPRGTCTITGPADPSPADQTQNVPPDAALVWTTVAATGGCSLGDWELFQDLYFGTTPDPPRIMQGFAYSPFDPGDLQPGTQYYWRVYAFQHWGNPAVGPLWTFRTAGTTATESTTWGRIKALYRN